MKKLTTILALFLLVTSAAFAQKGLHAAFKIIPHTSWMFNSDDSDAGDQFNYKSTFAYAMGISVNYHVTDGFGIGAEFLFSKQGQKYETNIPVTFISGEPVQTEYRRLNYMKIPILVFFNTNSEEIVYFQGEFGTSIGILTNAALIDGNGDEVTSSLVNFEDGYNKLNVGIVLGFGIGFNVHENFKINFGLRFDAAPGDAENKDFILWQNDPYRNGGGQKTGNTRNITGGLEFGFVYVLPTGR